MYGGQTSGRDICYRIYNTNDIAVQPMQLAAVGPVHLRSALDGLRRAMEPLMLARSADEMGAGET
jgi:hypothetical protein